MLVYSSVVETIVGLQVAIVIEIIVGLPVASASVIETIAGLLVTLLETIFCLLKSAVVFVL